MQRIAVKIGSNVLSRPDGTLDVTRMSAIVDQVAALYCRGIKIVLISSGAVASGRSEMRSRLDDGTRLDSVESRQLFSAVGQAKLINRYYELFRDHDIACGQVLTTKENFSTRRHYLNQRQCMRVMLDAGVIPIVNENDTVSVTELMFTDNDELSGLIAAMMDMDALIILSNIDGIYDGDPASPTSRVIPVIETGRDISAYISTAKSSLGRGGMASKNRIAAQVASEGIPVIIANGKRDGILTDIVDRRQDVPNTIFEAADRATSSVKKWIAHSDGFAKGCIHVNASAARAITGSGAASLLPVGVTEITGEWERGDIVSVIGPDGVKIAVGRAATDSDEARHTIGVHGARHLVHADYLYIE